MRELVPSFLHALASNEPWAYCRLVETRGSTPQKAGATMLVFSHGGQAGTLGGGCVEAEVKRRALAVLTEGPAEVATFQLDSDYGWDDGLICGGRMKVLIQPVVGELSRRYFALVAQLTPADGLTEAIVFDAEQSQLQAPANFLFDAQDQLVACLSGESPAGGIPDRVREQLRPLATRPRPYAALGIAFLPVLPRCPLLIVGGGHVGQAVANLAADLDFDVWVVDDRLEIVSQERFPKAARRIAGDLEQLLPELAITPDTYCLIVTRGHHHDERALFHLAQRGARYVGLIGSRRKIKLIYDDLLQAGFAPETLRRVFAPVGLDIGSQTVPEIAVSICAELVAHRNLNGAVPARPPPIG